MCGSDQRRPIAPNYFECQGVIATVSRTMVLDPVAGGHRPLDQRSERTCGQRYHDGLAPAAERSCRCGTYAIGNCGDCGDAACGDHSSLVDGQRLCGSCSARRSQRVAAAEAEQARARRDADRRVLPAFLAASAAANWPGSVPVFAAGPAVKAVRSASEQRRLERARKNDRAKVIFGLDLGISPHGWRQRRIAAAETERQVLADLPRSGPAPEPGPPVGRGWTVARYQVGDKPQTGDSRGHSGVPEPRYAQLVLMTDGSQVYCDYDDNGYLRLSASGTSPVRAGDRHAVGAALLAAARRHAKALGLEL